MTTMNIPVESFKSFYMNQNAINKLKLVMEANINSKWAQTSETQIKKKECMPLVLQYHFLDTIRLIIHLAEIYKITSRLYNFEKFEKHHSEELFGEKKEIIKRNHVKDKDSLYKSLKSLKMDTPFHSIGITCEIDSDQLVKIREFFFDLKHNLDEVVEFIDYHFKDDKYYTIKD